MPTTRKRDTTTYPQSEGNLAVADESLGLPQQPRVKTLSLVPAVVHDSTEKASDADGLASGTGTTVGMGLSLLLWCLIILVMYWIRLYL